jgi:nucleotide-binding universal stress UspA family protein
MWIFHQKRREEMYRKILVPLDGSETAEKVLPVAMGEGLHHQAKIILLRVIPPLRSSLMLSPKYLEQITEHANTMSQDYLSNVASRLQAEGLDVDTVIQSGPPAEKILDYAESEGCDLIVIGTRGETSASRWKLGGVSFKVIKSRTTMPVLVVNT